MANLFSKIKMSFFYNIYTLRDKIRGTEFYVADREDILIKLSTSWYSTAFYPGLLKKIFQYIPKKSVTGVLDLGSGKGLSMIVFSRNGIKNVGGVELRKDLFEICKKNLDKCEVKPSVLLNQDATIITDFSGFNTIFLFNPFPAVVCSQVIENMVTYYSEKKESCYVIYVNPVCHELFIKANFKVIGSFRAPISDFEVFIYKLS